MTVEGCSSSASRRNAWQRTMLRSIPSSSQGSSAKAANGGETKSPPEANADLSVRDEEDRYQILATSSLTLSGARVLKQGDTFAVFDRFGDIRSLGTRGAQGLYHDGTRFLSALRL